MELTREQILEYQDRLLEVLDDDFLEAEATVKAHQARSRKGKVYQIRQHQRRVKGGWLGAAPGAGKSKKSWLKLADDIAWGGGGSAIHFKKKKKKGHEWLGKSGHLKSGLKTWLAKVGREKVMSGDEFKKIASKHSPQVAGFAYWARANKMYKEYLGRKAA